MSALGGTAIKGLVWGFAVDDAILLSLLSVVVNGSGGDDEPKGEATTFIEVGP